MRVSLTWGMRMRMNMKRHIKSPLGYSDNVSLLGHKTTGFAALFCLNWRDSTENLCEPFRTKVETGKPGNAE